MATAASRQRTSERTSLGKSLYAAAIEGFAFWVAYGALEFFAVTLVRLLSDSLGVASPVTWRWTTRLLIGYAAAGAVTGVAGRLLFHLLRRPSAGSAAASEGRVERYAGALALAVAFLIGLLLQFELRGTDLIFLADALLVIVVLGVACLSDSWESRLRFLLRPWPIAFLLLGPSAVNANFLGSLSSLARVLVLGVTAGAVLFAAWATSRVAFLAGNRHRGTGRRLVVPIGVTAILIGSTLLVSSGRSLRASSAALLSGNANGPNIVLLTMDTVRADHTSLGGYSRDTTPVLRQLAKDWTVYTNLYAAADMTLSTHASMFTGLYPRQHGSVDLLTANGLGIPLASSFETLAEVLAAKGYATMEAAANSGFLAPNFGLTQGFQVSEVHDVIPLSLPGTAYVRGLGRAILTPFTATQDFDLGYRRAEEINADAYVLLDEMKRKGTSFFLFLNYMDAHLPYLPPTPYDRQFPGKDPRIPLSRVHQLEPHGSTTRLTANEATAIVSQYDGGIAYEDEQIGLLIEKLKTLGLYDRTLIMITSDHGEHWGEHQLYNHRVSVYQPLIHVPLAVKYPGQKQGSVVNTPVSQIDFMPTILNAAGLSIPTALPGLDLLTVDRVPPRVLFSATYMDHDHIGQIATAVIAKGYKFIDSTSGTRELYDLARDPEEKTNLYRITDPLGLEMRADLADWQKKVPPFHPKQQPGKMDQENLRRLKSLGYVQ